MSITNGPTSVQAVTRTLQIIVGALALGVFWFLLIVVLFLPQPARQPGGGPAVTEAPFITYIAIAFGASLLVASFFVPNLVVDAGLRGLVKTDSSSATTTVDPASKQIKPAASAYELLPLFQTQFIIGAALVEGGAFFATVAYMVEHQYPALGVAGALLVVLLSKFPTVNRVNVWLNEKLNRLNEMRNAGW